MTLITSNDHPWPQGRPAAGGQPRRRPGLRPSLLLRNEDEEAPAPGHQAPGLSARWPAAQPAGHPRTGGPRPSGPQRWLRALLRCSAHAWMLVPPLVLVLGLVRLAQLAYHWPTGWQRPLSELAAVLLQGLRFDLKVCAIVALVLMPLLAWLGQRARLRLMAALALVCSLLSLINLHYYGFYKTPIDAVVFGLFEDDTAAILATVWRDFPVLATVLAAVALSLSAVQAYRWLLARAWPARIAQALPAAGQWLALGLALLALLLAGKGTLRAMALQRQNFSVTTSQFLNDMVPNGVIALWYAWDSRKMSLNLQDPLAGLRKLGFDSPLAAARALGLPHGSADEVKAALVAHELLPAGTPRKHLVFFLMESWSAAPLLHQGPGFDVLGRLAPALAGACHFSNFDSAQGSTHSALEAILFASPLTPLTQGEHGRKPIPWSVARVAQQAGYHTLFASSVRAGWRDLDRVLKRQGFDEVVDAATLQQIHPEAELGVWGVWDRYLFEYVAGRLAQQPAHKPLFVFALTSTNHPPYDLPPDYQRVPRDLQLWPEEAKSATLAANLDTYHYAADQLGAFVQAVRRTELAQRTIVAATGDHNVRSFSVDDSAQRRHLAHQVPFVIWGQGLDCGKQLALPASHRDVFSTLLPLAGIDGPYLNAGRNLLRPLPQAPDAMNAPRALYFSGQARNARGLWTLGEAGSFVCSPPRADGADCSFNPQDDLQERARLALLDWNVRVSLGR